MRMVSNVLPTLKFGDPIDTSAKAKKFDENDTNRENMYYNLQEKSDAKYMFMVTIKDIETGEEGNFAGSQLAGGGAHGGEPNAGSCSLPFAVIYFCLLLFASVCCVLTLF